MTNAGLDLVKQYEGMRLSPYLCPAGIPTIGFGTTIYPDGTPVTLDDLPITKAKAVSYLKTELDKYEAKVDELTNGRATDYELAAMTSLAYNIGLAAFEGSSVLRLYNQGKLREASAAFGLWNKARDKNDGVLKVMPGLVARRAAESAMFSNSVVGDPMPQEVEAPKSLAQSRTFAGVATTATGTVATVTAGVQAVSALKSSLDSAAPWFPGLLVAGVVLAVVGLGYLVYARWDDKRQGIR